MYICSSTMLKLLSSKHFTRRLRCARAQFMVAMAHTATSGTKLDTSPDASKPVIRGVVFDMDGTVTIPVIDFAEMRRRCGVTEGDILDVINKYDPARRAAAYAVIAEMENAALANLKVMPGAQQLCAALDAANIPRGLITRNVRRSVSVFHEQHISSLGLAPFTPAITRECAFAYKPSPEALLHICSTWGVPPAEVVMVGDSIKDDVVCGNRAGAVTVLLDYNGINGAKLQPLEGERCPQYIVHTLQELQDLLTQRYTLLSPPHPQPAVELLAVD